MSLCCTSCNRRCTNSQITKIHNQIFSRLTLIPDSCTTPTSDTWLGSEVGHGLGFVGRENIRLWIFVVCESSSTACVTQTHRCILPVT